MRLVGTFNDKSQALRFSNYLKSQSIDAQLRQNSQEIEVWALDDHCLEQAKQLYQVFNEKPSDPRFETSYKDYTRKKREKSRKLKQHYRQYFQRPGANQITIALLVISVLVYLLTLSPSLGRLIVSNLIINVPGFSAITVWTQQPWRLLTPMFLHFGILHILFNMFWLYDFGTLIEKKEGKIFYSFFIFFASLGSGLLQFFIHGPMFGGMSGVVYALFGYLWFSAKYNLRSGYYISNSIVFWMLGWFILCFLGVIGSVANYGHLGGLLVGVLFALLKKYKQDRAVRPS